MKDPWPCICYAETTSMNDKHRYIEFAYDGSGDMIGIGMQLFAKRIRKHHIWQGVKVHFCSPLGQNASRVYEG